MKRFSYILVLLHPSGQAMPNRMIPGGGNSQAMANRPPGAPNGMCEYALFLPGMECRMCPPEANSVVVIKQMYLIFG